MWICSFCPLKVYFPSCTANTQRKKIMAGHLWVEVAEEGRSGRCVWSAFLGFVAVVKVQWAVLWLSGVVVGITSCWRCPGPPPPPLPICPRMTLVKSGRPRVAVRLELRCRLLGHGRLGSCHLMIALRVVLLCRRLGLTLLGSGHYWIAHRSSCAVLSRTRLHCCLPRLTLTTIILIMWYLHVSICLLVVNDGSTNITRI